MAVEIDLKRLVDKAQKLGADEAEIYYEHAEKNDIEIYNGQVDSLEAATEKGIGVRVFVDDQMGFAYTSNFEAEALKEVIKEALFNAEVASEDEARKLPEGEYEYKELDIYNFDLKETGIEEKIDLALKMEEEALNYNSKIKSVVSVNYGDYDTNIKIVNTKGLDEKYRTNGCYVYLNVIAADGENQQTGNALSYGRTLLELTPEETAREAAQNALKLLGGKQISSREAEVVFTPKIGSMFIYVLSRALTADAVQKGKSLFADKLEEQVASKQVNIIDDGTLEAGLAAAPFDDEGVPCSPTEIIKNGKLVNYLYDTYTANKGGVTSTGNGQRGGYGGVPDVAPTNFYLAPGDKTKEEIINGVDSGFYVHKVSGLVTGGANSISGEFSVGATGQWIENGEIKGPITEVTIAGELISFLQDIVEIGDDLTFNPMVGSFGSPTFKVKKLAISGS
jgi:PmbA protein